MLELQGRKESLHALAFSADNRFLAVGGTACRPDVFDLTAPAAKRPLFRRLPHTVADVWIGPDGERIVAAELYAGAVTRLRRTDPAAGDRFEPLASQHSWAPPRITPDGAGVVFGEAPARWDFAAGPEPVWRARADRHRAMVHAYGVAPDGRRLAVCDGRFDATYPVRVHDMTAAAAPRTFGTVSNPVRRFAWAPGGALLAAAVDTRVLVWGADGAAAGEYRIPGRKHIADVAFHPGGRALAVADNTGTVRLLDRATWAEVRTFAWGLPKARCLAFSPDGTLAAAGSDTGKVVVWDVDG